MLPWEVWYTVVRELGKVIFLSLLQLLGTTLLASYVNPDMKTASVFHRLKGYGVPVPVAALKMVELHLFLSSECECL